MVGKNIKRLRTEKDMTQEELAERLNVTRQAVSSWETGKTQPDLETLGRLAELLETTVESLIYGVEKDSRFSVKQTAHEGIDKMTAIGAALAVVLSYVKWKSVGWAILHGILGWVYVIYYVIRY